MAEGKVVGRVSVRVMPDTSKFRRDAERSLKRAAKGLKVKVPVKLTKKSVAKVEQQLRSLGDDAGPVRIKTQIDPARTRAQLRAVTAELQTLARAQKVEIPVEVDSRQAQQALSGLSRMSQQMSRMRGFGGRVGGAVAIGALIAVLAPLVGLVTTALLTLPGLVAAVATPVAALALGMDGLKRAASTLEAPLADLKRVMSDKVESQFTPVFKQLGRIFPTLEKSLPKVSQGLADVAKSFADTVTSQKGMRQIRNTISNIGEAISDSAPGVRDFTSGFITLAEKLSEKLPSISKWFNGAGKSFTDWIDKMSENGTLDTAFDKLGETLKTILETLGKLGEKGLDFMSDPEKVDKFIKSLETIGDLLAKIVDLSDKLNSGPGLLGPALTPKEGREGSFFSWESIKKDLTDPFVNMDFANSPVGKSIEWLKQQFVGVGETIKNTFTGVWNWVATTAQTAFASVVETVTNTFNNIAAIVSTVGGVLGQAWTTAVAGARAAWNTVASVVSGAVGKIISAVTQLPARVGALLASAWSAVVAATGGAFRSVVSAVQTGIESAVSAVSAGVSNILAFFAALPGQIQSALSGLASTLFTIGVQMMQGLLNGIVSGAGAVIAKAGEIAGNIAGAFSNVLEIFSPSRVFFGFGRNIVQGLANGMKHTTPAEAASKTLAERVKKAWDEEIRDDLIGSGKQIAQAPFRTLASDLGFSSSGAVGSAINSLINGSVTPNAKEQGPTYIVKDLDEAQRKENLRQKKESLQYRKR
ncbi:phage tail protein [Gordonia tangerina]|uniref:Tape measure protein n=1 Tax=Gordonia tangerina TaxID=2911060 RepID=A0ABS9DID2_9ACTN|nr:hypothetical protein [Gordonia tangerina]MCF3938379.1 hypothetical protein [Gordonia tangerina]